MHRYYQKNLKKWHKTLNSYMNYISYELESLTGQSYDTLIQEIWTNYQDEMLERFPYIGGDAASSFVMFAFFLKGSHNALEKAFKTFGSSFFNCLVKAVHQQCLK